MWHLYAYVSLYVRLYDSHACEWENIIPVLFSRRTRTEKFQVGEKKKKKKNTRDTIITWQENKFARAEWERKIH